MDIDKVEISLNKLLPGILPAPIKHIAFDVRHTGPDQYRLHTAFSVPDEWWDSLDSINKAAFKHDVRVKLRKKIKDYTDLNVELDKDNMSMIKLSDWKG